MSATLLGALATAGALGVTHALEPDHLAGISSLTSRYGDSRLSALVGVCFSAGHVALVLVWLLVGYLLLGTRTFPAVLDTVGSLVVIVALAAFGAVLTVRGYRAAARTHVETDHAHANDSTGSAAGLDSYHTDHLDEVHHGHDHTESEPHLHLPLVGTDHTHAHTTGAYLKTGLVGALFTLSPPLSMIAFLGTVVPAYGFPVAGVAVAAYAVGITVTMGAIGAGVGGLFGITQGHERAYGLLRVVTGLAVLSLAVVMATSVVPALG